MFFSWDNFQDFLDINYFSEFWKYTLCSVLLTSKLSPNCSKNKNRCWFCTLFLLAWFPSSFFTHKFSEFWTVNFAHLLQTVYSLPQVFGFLFAWLSSYLLESQVFVSFELPLFAHLTFECSVWLTFQWLFFRVGCARAVAQNLRNNLKVRFQNNGQSCLFFSRELWTVFTAKNVRCTKTAFQTHERKTNCLKVKCRLKTHERKQTAWVKC